MENFSDRNAFTQFDGPSDKSKKCVMAVLISLNVIFCALFLTFCILFFKARKYPMTIGVAGQVHNSTDLEKIGVHEGVVQSAFVQALNNLGATVVMLPVLRDDWNSSTIKTYIDRVDGLILQGGPDIDPSFYGEEPLPEIGSFDTKYDKFQIELYHEAKNRKLPIYGACRGFQLMNVAENGSMYQDYKTYYPIPEGVTVEHLHTSNYSESIHYVNVEENSQAYQILKNKKRIFVNSLHHQVVKNPGQIFNVVGKADDGVVEIVENKDFKKHFILGTQFHPEYMDVVTDEVRPILESFIKAVKKFYNNKK